MSSLLGALARSLVFGIAFAVPAAAREWSRGFEITGIAGEVRAFALFDDGSHGGPKLVAAGQFETAGATEARSIAIWNGHAWEALGDGIAGRVDTLHTFDDGSGSALYAGGSFQVAGTTLLQNVARWDGEEWTALGAGLNGIVYTIASHDDGGGPALYAGGQLFTAGGQPIRGVVRFDGTSWSTVGGDAGVVSVVRTLCVFDDGTGAALYAGGGFSQLGGVSANNIAKWNGTTWSALASGLNADAAALAAHDDGSGRALFVTGYFTQAGGVAANRIARWNGTSWSAIGAGLAGPPGASGRALAAYDDGSGPALFVGGLFTSAGGAPAANAAKWNGSTFAPIAPGTSGPIGALRVADVGTGRRLVAGGAFAQAGGKYVGSIAAWNGATWSPVSPGFGVREGWTSPAIEALVSHDDGSGPALFAAGTLSVAGTAITRGVARWNGAAWSALGAGITDGSTAYSLATHDDGGGAKLYLGGSFSDVDGVPALGVAAWDGTSWSALGSGLGGQHAFVFAMTSFDDGNGPALYVAGAFTTAAGSVADGVARWDGTSWSALASGIPDGAVLALLVFDDGNGPALYAAGLFDQAGGVTVGNVARWDGTSWSAVGTLPGGSSTLVVHDDGSGAALYAGGLRWNGTSWNPVGTPPGPIDALAVFDDGAGNGPELYASGKFLTAGGVVCPRVAKWDGSAWSPLGTGLDHDTTALDVLALTVHDDASGTGPALFAGGLFSRAGGRVVGSLAKWTADPTPGEPFCAGDGVDPLVTTPCPCNNVGGLGRGCRSSNLDGARLSATGSTADGSVELLCSNVVFSQTLCVFLKSGTQQGAGLPFGHGIRCVDGMVERIATLDSQNTFARVPAPVETPGTTIFYQVWYRDGPLANCQAEAFNASNGYRITW